MAQTINVSGGATSPTSVSFTVLSDAASHTINASFNSNCADSEGSNATLTVGEKATPRSYGSIFGITSDLSYYKTLTSFFK